MVVDLDGFADAAELLAPGSGTRCVLFDFDGPICRLFPEGSSRGVADELRELLTDFGVTDVLTPQEQADKDPHVVLRAVHRSSRGGEFVDLVKALEAKVTEGELAAARTAWRTPDADVLVRQLAERGLRLAVVTNNASEAADAYLQDKHLREYFEAIHGRSADPDLMKPDPDVLFRALRDLGLPPESAVMIGDTPTDVEAAERAGVRFIGYGRNPEKRARLRDAGAKVVVGSFGPLVHQVGESDADEPEDLLVGEAVRRAGGG